MEREALIGINGTLFFTACGGPAPFGILTECELWKSNGTAAGTVPATDVRPGPASSSPSSLMELGQYLIFAATNDVYGRELWRIRTGSARPCIGDCDSKGAVTVDEILTAVHNATGGGPA